MPDRILQRTIPLLFVFTLGGCVTVPNRPGRPSHYVDPRESHTGTLRIASEDIMRATEEMVADILAESQIISHPAAPRIVVDDRAFYNESDDDINKKMFTDRLRVRLERAAGGRLVILARHYAHLAETERLAEEEGAVTPGTKGETEIALGYDYRLGGRITSIYRRDRQGNRSRYYQIIFELFKRGTMELVWSKQYEFKKAGQESILYD